MKSYRSFWVLHCMANNRFSLESVKGMTIELQSKSKRERSLHQNLCDLEHFWQLVKPVRNSMISTVKILFLKMNSEPPQCLETGMFGCTLFWIIFENPKCIILKSFSSGSHCRSKACHTLWQRSTEAQQ